MTGIITNLILMLCGYVPAIIKLDNRIDYYTAINTSSLDAPENLAKFIGLACIESLELALKAAKGESIDINDLEEELRRLDEEVRNGEK